MKHYKKVPKAQNMPGQYCPNCGKQLKDWEYMESKCVRCQSRKNQVHPKYNDNETGETICEFRGIEFSRQYLPGVPGYYCNWQGVQYENEAKCLEAIDAEIEGREISGFTDIP